MAPLSPLDDAAVRTALSRVQDPELNKDLVSLGMIKAVAIEGARVAITIELPSPARPCFAHPL